MIPLTEHNTKPKKELHCQVQLTHALPIGALSELEVCHLGSVVRLALKPSL